MKDKPERKKLSMKTRLLIIIAMFILVNLAFYISSEFSDESESDKEIEQLQENIEEEQEEKLYYKFNPPPPP